MGRGIRSDRGGHLFPFPIKGFAGTSLTWSNGSGLFDELLGGDVATGGHQARSGESNAARWRGVAMVAQKQEGAAMAEA